MGQDQDKETAVKDEEIDFHEAAIIDADGNEVKITEEMVRSAINELDKDAYEDVEKPKG